MLNKPPTPNSRGRFCHTLMLAIVSLPGTMSAAAPCFSTPESAASRTITAEPKANGSTDAGYRVIFEKIDVLLQKRWILIADCSHPEWPAQSVLSESESTVLTGLSKISPFEMPAVTQQANLVQVGETVRLWKQETSLRMELVGVSEQSGELGKRVRVRISRTNSAGESAEVQMAGIVRGNAEVEIER